MEPDGGDGPCRGYQTLAGEAYALRAALKTIADHSLLHTDFPHNADGFKAFARHILETV